jgi:hypothetical protein
MDFTQKKLTKEEWEFLELPVNDDEMKILKLIHASWENVGYTYNENLSMLSFMKMKGSDDTHLYIYKNYFEGVVHKINKQEKININIKNKKIKLKKIDQMRIKNLSKKLDNIKPSIYEYILLDIVVKFVENKKSILYYTLTQLLKNNILNLNIYVKMFVNGVLVNHKNSVSKTELIKNAYLHIEKNPIIYKYRDIKLYEHQKRLMQLSKMEHNKLILYQAPTGTGKTLSPIGLSKGKKVIFTCAAKHIGLQLAKACISLEIPIAIAFGCKDPGDIRLHYFAAKEYVKNRKSGYIFRVDNSVGDKVQVIITDIQSYNCAMNYMLAFNDPNDIVWYWDEPTITLDYETHEFHETLESNWNKNEIGNVVLSSATLPCKEDIMPMILGFKHKFKASEMFEIKSYECKKSIPLLNSKNEIVMPHTIFDNFKKMKACAKHIENNKTLLRHLDVKKMVEFIIYVNKKKYLKENYTIDNYFQEIDDINIISLKLYYLKLLGRIKNNFEKCYDHFKKVIPMYNSSIKITTCDAYTLTDGPTIFITENVDRLAKFYLNKSEIPENELDNLELTIKKNEKYTIELEKVEEEERQRKEKQDGIKQEKDHSKNMDSTEYKLLETYTREVGRLKARIKTVELSKKYVPNSRVHINLWSSNKSFNGVPFTSDIDEKVVQEIMYLNINRRWKILLLMGIGVFTKHPDKRYMDIMKTLAEQQHLYLIIASSDYIYGTNYQFCHGYLSKDLENLTQEKMIQAFGRIGRSSSQNDYTLRLRDDGLIKKLFTKEDNKPEVVNMNRLFG